MSFPVRNGSFVSGIERATSSELIVIDKHYLDRLRNRSKVLAAHPELALGALPDVRVLDAVQELYSYLTATYLPTRYPSMFSASKGSFHNLVTGAVFSLDPPKDPLEGLRRLGQAIEDDLFLLQREDEGHRCVAFLSTMPSGFNPSHKIGKLLKDIHGPVPSYDKIALSMERAFAKLQAGRSIKRINVSWQPKARFSGPRFKN